MELKNSAYIFEINLDIMTAHIVKDINYREISRYPAVTRDVAFVVPARVEADFMLNSILKQKEDLLENVGIFDIYVGKGLPEGTKSLGLRFSYRAPDKTLTDIEVNTIHQKIVLNTVQWTGAKIRG
jgi:phenylalanyl-tRNA synthetase beta chain